MHALNICMPALFYISETGNYIFLRIDSKNVFNEFEVLFTEFEVKYMNNFKTVVYKMNYFSLYTPKFF